MQRERKKGKKGKKGKKSGPLAFFAFLAYFASPALAVRLDFDFAGYPTPQTKYLYSQSP